MSDFYICHADREKHKYVAKVKKGKKFRYFYSKAEYEAYLKGKDKKKSSEDDDKSISGALSGLSSKVLKMADEGKKAVEKIFAKLSKKEAKNKANQKKSKNLDKPDKNGDYEDGHGEPKDHKYVAKLKMKNGKFRYFYSQQELAAYYKNHPDEVPKNARNLPLISDSESPEDAMKKINRHYDPTDSYAPGYSNNCYSCTLAYDMRRRGYDVDSIYDEDGDTLKNIESCYKDAHFDKTFKKGSALQKDLEQKYPEGAHGQICVLWKGGGGHSMAWEIQDGKAVIRDCQSGTVYKNFDKIVGSNMVTGRVNILRTDDKQISDKMATKITTDQRKSVYEDYEKRGYELDSNQVEPILDTLEDYNDKKGIDTVTSRRRRGNGVRRR